MKSLFRFALILPLLAWPVAAQSPRLSGSDLARFEGAVHANWHAAVLASGIDLGQPIELTPVAVHRGVALYELVGLHTGETASAYVSLPQLRAAAPEVERDGDLDRAVEAACATPGRVHCSSFDTDFSLPDASRCTVTFYEDVNFSGLPMSTNVDWNSLGNVYGPGATEYNDLFTSVRTTCAPVYVYKNANWLSTSLYIPANTSISNLGVYGFNDVISSMWHVLP